jgi:hypothetical protein
VTEPPFLRCIPGRALFSFSATLPIYILLQHNPPTGMTSSATTTIDNFSSRSLPVVQQQPA